MGVRRKRNNHPTPFNSGEQFVGFCHHCTGTADDCRRSYVLLSILQDDFSSTGYTINGQKAFFANIALSKTLTMNLDSIVSTVYSLQNVEDFQHHHLTVLTNVSLSLSLSLSGYKYFSLDMNNILLENLGDTRTLQAVFELEALVLMEPPLQLKAEQLFSFVFSDLHPSFSLWYDSLAGTASKPPPQEILVKLEKEQTFKELSQESSLFAFKLGVVKPQCCLLMDFLVFDSSEIIVDGKVKATFASLASSIIGRESVLNEINYLPSPENLVNDDRPSTEQFREKLPWFLNALPSADCAKGYESGVIRASEFHTYHTPHNIQGDYINALLAARESAQEFQIH
ncbi:hypothetical protein CRYUN_Cryun09bG0037800 [Craigia yunnanensis]